MAQQIVKISSLAQAEQATKDRAVDQVALLLDESASLNDAAGIKADPHPGVLGFRLMNPELLDSKCAAKAKLEEAFEEMLRAGMEGFSQEIDRVDLLIAAVKEKLAIPDASLPHRGPPVIQRNRGVRQCVYLQSVFGEYPPYEDVDPGYQGPYDTQEERDLAIQRDRDSQKAWWKMNLTFLESKKQILEEKACELERELRIAMETALESRSFLGAGYADYSFRH